MFNNKTDKTMDMNRLCARRKRLLSVLTILFLTIPAMANSFLAKQVLIGAAPICTDTIAAKEICAQADAYYGGKNGMFMNRDKAKELYIRAAEMNYAPAQYEIYEKWKTSDCETAMKYLQRAAEQKYFPAMENMFLEYIEPEAPCVKENTEKALYWARLGAESGDDYLQFSLGMYYFEQNL